MELYAPFNVKFTNNYEGYSKPLVIKFTSNEPNDVRSLISALCAFYSGDPYECVINGEEVELDKDWGLKQ